MAKYSLQILKEINKAATCHSHGQHVPAHMQISTYHLAHTPANLDISVNLCFFITKCFIFTNSQAETTIHLS